LLILYGKISGFKTNMNICSETHIPSYKITYKCAKGSKYEPELLV